MSDRIQFTGVTLKSFSRNKNGGNAIFHANFTKSVSDAMGWGGMAPGQTSVKLEGVLAAATVVLQPKDGALAKWKIEFSGTAVKSFEATRLELEGKKGKGHRYELRFHVEFVDVTACRYLEEFITNAGEAKSTLDVSYTKQAEQANLLDEDELVGDERRQATMAEND